MDRRRYLTDDRRKRETNLLVYRIQVKNKYVALDYGSISFLESILLIFTISFFHLDKTNDITDGE